MDLPKPHTAATVTEWAEELLPDFIKQERETRLAAEKIAAEKEKKRAIARNQAKVRFHMLNLDRLCHRALCFQCTLHLHLCDKGQARDCLYLCLSK